MKKFLILYSIATIFVACSTTKQPSYEEMMANAPAWVKSTPSDPAWYHGIGSATKTQNSTDYRERARQNALSEIAGNISVEISSSSVFNQYEFDNNYSEYFRDNIKLSTQKYIEGYELVDSWETADQYRVYYRLSKAGYERLRQERVAKALSVSKGDLNQAEAFRQKGNTPEAARFYVKAIEGVKDFLGEDLKTEVDGQNRSYNSFLFSEFIGLLQSIKINYPVSGIEVLRGQIPSPENIEIAVEDENGKRLNGISVNTSFTWFPGKITESVTDATGKFRLKLIQVNSKKKDEMIVSVVNLEKLIKENTSDAMLRKMLTGIKVPEFVLPVKISSQKFYLSSSSTNLGNSYDFSGIDQELISLLKKDGFEVVTSDDLSDFQILATATTRQGTEKNGRFSALLNATFTLKTQTGTVILTKNFTDISGVGNNYSAAGEDAFKALTGQIRVMVYPEIISKIQ